MKIYNAWKSFEKTGSIKKYLEFKNICNLYHKEKKQRVNVDTGADNEIDSYRRK